MEINFFYILSFYTGIIYFKNKYIEYLNYKKQYLYFCPFVSLITKKPIILENSEDFLKLGGD